MVMKDIHTLGLFPLFPSNGDWHVLAGDFRESEQDKKGQIFRVARSRLYTRADAACTCFLYQYLLNLANQIFSTI